MRTGRAEKPIPSASDPSTRGGRLWTGPALAARGFRDTANGRQPKHSHYFSIFLMGPRMGGATGSRTLRASVGEIEDETGARAVDVPSGVESSCR